MEFRLGVQNEDPETGNLTIEFLEELTENEFNEFSAALAKLEELHSVRRLKEFVTLNEQDLTDYLNDSVKVLLNKSQNFAGGRSSEMREIHININRLILNYLSSTRTFIDHTTTFLVRKLGEHSEEFAGFKGQLSKFYDQSFAYRFLTKLRNYSQHVDIPIEGVQFLISYNDDRTLVQGNLTVEFKRDHLLEKFQKWGTVKTDLLAMETLFPLMPLIYEMTLYIELIEKSAELIFRRELSEAANYLTKKMETVKHKDGDVFAGYNFEDSEDGSLLNFSQKTVPLETLNYIIEILAE
jgi:hypothetical protein